MGVQLWQVPGEVVDGSDGPEGVHSGDDQEHPVLVAEFEPTDVRDIGPSAFTRGVKRGGVDVSAVALADRPHPSVVGFEGQIRVGLDRLGGDGQIDAQGVTPDSRDANRAIGYITKYVTKHVGDCHPVTSDRRRAHLDRLWAELQHTPCSGRCPNWLLHGIQPRHATGKLKPGRCKGKAHQRATLGIGGRRVLISRDWSGKTLADHKADTLAWVRNLLAVTEDLDHAPTGDDGGTSRYAWELARPDDPDVPPIAHRLLRSVSERSRWRAQLQAAKDRASQGIRPNVSATDDQTTTGGER